MTDEDYASREDYVARLATECDISIGRAEADVDRALTSEDVRHRWHVRRRGWRSDAYRFSYVEGGEPDPGPGPVRLLGMRPLWLESNGIERVEYCVQDLDRETRHLRPKTKKKQTLKLDQQMVNKALHDFAVREGRRLKQDDDRALAELDRIGAMYRQRRVAFQKLPAEYRYGRGKPTHDLTTG